MSLPRPKQASFKRLVQNYDNPDSVASRCSPEVGKAIMSLPKEYCDLTEEELHEKCPEPAATTLQLRRLFWMEYDRSIENHELMDMSRVYTGVCSRRAFYNTVIKYHTMAWILSPPKEYLIETEHLLSVGLRQLGEILNLPLKNSMGFIDTKLAEVKLKAVMMLDMRLKGAYVQRSVQLNHNINENNNTNVSIDMSEKNQALSVDDRISQLEQEIAALEHKPVSSKVPKFDKQKEDTLLPRVDIVDAEFQEFPGDIKE